MKNKISFLLTIIIVLSSCTMQKRYHNSGFNLELNSHFTRSNRTGGLPNKSAQKAIQIPNAQSSKVVSNRSTVAEENIPFNAIDVRDIQESDVIPFVNISSETPISINPFNSISQFKLIKTGVHQVGVKSVKANGVVNGAALKPLKKSSSSEGGGSISRGFGIFLIVVGIIVFLFVSLIVGLLLALLGLVLMASGKSSNSQRRAADEPATEEKKIEYVDVLYLQNGSIIRGVILELIPNGQVKIQTNDGSVFVYSMDQVLKITKQPK